MAARSYMSGARGEARTRFSINLVVGADIEQMNFCFPAFRVNELEDDAEVVARRTRPASIEVAGELVRAEGRMIRVGFELQRHIIRS